MPNPHYCELLTPVLDHYHVCIQSGRYSAHCVVTTRHCYKDSPATDLGPIYTIHSIYFYSIYSIYSIYSNLATVAAISFLDNHGSQCGGGEARDTCPGCGGTWR